MKFSLVATHISALSMLVPSILATALLSPTSAVTLVNSAGTWRNPIGGAETIEYITAGDEAALLWGYALVPGVKSGLGYSGAGLSTITSEIPFWVGTLRHFNNPVSPPSVTAVALQIQLNLGDVAGASINRAFTFDFAIDETPNTTPCVYASAVACSDRITFLTSTASESFAVGGTFYSLELLGFSDRPSLDGSLTNNLVSEFISQERETNTAFLFGRLTQARSEAVPEPGAIAPFAILGLSFAIWRSIGKPR